MNVVQSIKYLFANFAVFFHFFVVFLHKSIATKLLFPSSAYCLAVTHIEKEINLKQFKSISWALSQNWKWKWGKTSNLQTAFLLTPKRPPIFETFQWTFYEPLWKLFAGTVWSDFSHHHFPCSVWTKLSSKTFSKHSHRMLEGMVSNLGRRCVMLTTLRQTRKAGFDTVGGVWDEVATLLFLRHNMWSFTFFRLKNYIFQITT